MAIEIQQAARHRKAVNSIGCWSDLVKMFGKGFSLVAELRFLSCRHSVDEAYMRGYSYYDTAELKNFQEGCSPAIERLYVSIVEFFQSQMQKTI